MSNLTRIQARDEMLAIVNTAAASYDPDFIILWDDDDSNKRPKDRQPYATAGVYHIAGQQVTLGSLATNRTFRRYGSVEILVYTPEGDGLTLADEFVTVIHDAFEGTTSINGIFFRDVRTVEEGKSGSFRMTKVIADFEYDQVK